jgi:signal transduction histidine kinase
MLIIVVVFIMLIVVGLWLYNRNSLKNKQHELWLLQKSQHDKERIARDLHDNIGGQLSYIIYSLDGINDEDKQRRSEVTDSIHQSVRSVISSLRETIWAISDANIDVQDFSDKLKLFARNLFMYGNTQIYFTENINTKRELNSLLGLNLYRICQEILNNAFKYAHATELKIDLQCDEEKLFIVISDNGVGFDITQQKKEHYGLQNIKKRAMEFGISLTLQTTINKGTRYGLMV